MSAFPITMNINTKACLVCTLCISTELKEEPSCVDMPMQM